MNWNPMSWEEAQADRDRRRQLAALPKYQAPPPLPTVRLRAVRAVLVNGQTLEPGAEFRVEGRTAAAIIASGKAERA